MDCRTGAKMTQIEVIKQECEKYAKLPGALFIGYNTVFGSRMYGTLDGVSVDRCLEAPVAENLMAGMAIGMALQGMRPVVCFERHDFVLLALDALVNHIDKLGWISGDQFKLPIVIRMITGASGPLKAGPMHTQKHVASIRMMMKYTPVIAPAYAGEFEQAWDMVGKTKSGAVVIVEHKDLYNCPLLPR